MKRGAGEKNKRSDGRCQTTDVGAPRVRPNLGGNMYQSKRKNILLILYVNLALIFCLGSFVSAGTYIADHTVAKESVLRSIPVSAINAAKDNLHIAYFHSSHGSRVITGMTGLKSYKTGDDTLYDFSTNGTPVSGKLDIDDDYVGGNDLSAKDGITSGHTQWYHETVTFLDDSANADINVVMWSWCNPAGHDHQQYIDDYEDLISQYGVGGSKIGTGGGEKPVPVTFVFMSGHPNGDGESASDTSAYHCHSLVRQHCLANNRFMIDYWDIETHGMDDVYYPYADDNGVDTNASPDYEFYKAWQTAHSGEFFPNSCAHCSDDQELTCNRKAYAAWWVWARIAGWDDESGAAIPTISEMGMIVFGLLLLAVGAMVLRRR